MLYAIGVPGGRIRFFLDEPIAGNVAPNLEPDQVAVPVQSQARGAISPDGTAVIPDPKD